MQHAYNYKMANKGRSLEELIIYSCNQYYSMHIANIQKISTPWTVIRAGKNIVSAYPSGKSTLDFRGTVRGGYPVSFDCKESTDPKGLPLAYIKKHQVDFIDGALLVGENSFLICEIKPLQKQYIIPGDTVVNYWQSWLTNKGKRGYNFIPVEKMIEIKPSRRAVACDFIASMTVLDQSNIVRCKDCIHYLGLAECEALGSLCGGTDFYCKYGERSINDNA